MTIGDLLKRAQQLLGDSPHEAEIILSTLLVPSGSASGVASGNDRALSRSELYLRLNEEAAENLIQKTLEVAQARSSGETLQYLLGRQEFLDHEYRVRPGVLVPRPETEILVIEALRLLQQKGASPVQGIEVGLGSGMIAIELLSRFPALKVLATEISPVAMDVALANAERILGKEGAYRLETHAVQEPQEVLAGLKNRFQPGSLDFIISNPPYLDPDSSIETEPEVRRNEPSHALFAPAGDLLYFYREIARDSVYFLKPEGWVFLEVPHERAGQVRTLFEQSKWNLAGAKDLSGRDRMVAAQLRRRG